MTKRTDAKELYLAALRGDAKAQRACTAAGKPCGGRCIPKHWNCRIKGEGATPPTRGNAVQLSPEQKEKIQKARNERKKRRVRTFVGGAALVGAAALGAAALGAKNPAAALKLKRKSGMVSQGLGAVSAVGGATAGVAGAANMAVGSFDIGARVGMAVARRKRDLGAFKRLTKQRFKLQNQLKPIEVTRNKAQSTLRKAQEKLSIEKTRLEAAELAMKRKGQRRAGYALGKNPQSIAQTDRARATNLKSAQTAFRKANYAVNKSQAAFDKSEAEYQSVFRQLNIATTRASKLKSKLLQSQNPIRNAYSSGLSSAQRSFRAGRSKVSSFIRTQGVRGPKPDPRSWQEQRGMDEAERSKYITRELDKMRAKKTGKYGAQGRRKTGPSFRPDEALSANAGVKRLGKLKARNDALEKVGKACGNSHIPKQHKCTKNGSVAGQPINKKAIAASVAIGAVGALSIGVAMDARQLKKGFGIPPTDDFRSSMKSVMKEKGIKDIQEASAVYYDKLVSKEGWKTGELVYTRSGKGADFSHFAVYMGKKDGVHSFAQIGADGITAKTGSLQVTQYGPGVPPGNRGAAIFARPPKEFQAKNTLSPDEIASRIDQMKGKTLKYEAFSDNCESWARMIVGDGTRSQQANKLTLTTKTAIRGVYRGLEGVVEKWGDNDDFPVQTGPVTSAKSMARLLDKQDPKGNVGAFSALLSKYRRDDISSQHIGLIPANELLDSTMSAIEAVARVKRYLMLVTAIVVDMDDHEKGKKLNPAVNNGRPD